MIALDDDALDAVRELVNIASGNAATALALLVGRRTMISVPRVTLEPAERIATLVGVPGQSVVVTIPVLGDISGNLVFLMPVERAHAFSAALLGRPAPTSGAFDADARSALEETANVLAGAYTGALGSVMSGIVMISVPAFGVELPAEVLSVSNESEGGRPQALCIETCIMIGAEHLPCDAHIVFLPVNGALKTIVGAMEELLRIV